MQGTPLLPDNPLSSREWNSRVTLVYSVLWVESLAFIPGYEAFPQNVRCSREGIVFATVHVVGSHNGLAPFDPNSFVQRNETDDIEVEQRISAAMAWIEATFEQARCIG
jgi:hypothetical protein